VTAVSRRGMTCGFSLPEPLADPRFSKVDEVVPGWWSHTLRVTRPEELDDEVQGWLRESYRLMGMQERLSPGRRVPDSQMIGRRSRSRFSDTRGDASYLADRGLPSAHSSISVQTSSVFRGEIMNLEQPRQTVRL